MSSLLGILFEFLRRFRPTKDHIKRFLRYWTSLLAYLVRKMGKWRFLWSSNRGTIRNPKPDEPLFPSHSTCSSSVKGGSVCLGRIGKYAVAASTVPASANQPLRRERAEPQSNSAPPTPALATPANIPWALDLSTINQTVGSSHANHSPGSLNVQSHTGDRVPMMWITPTSLHAPVQKDRLSQDPRATHRQFGPGPRAPSPQLSPNTTQFDGILHPTIGSQGLTNLLSSSPHTQVRPVRPDMSGQRASSVGLSIRNPSTPSLPTSNNAQETTEEPIVMDTSTRSYLHNLPSGRAETTLWNIQAASSPTSVFALPEGCLPQPIVSDQIQRYTKNATTSRKGTLPFVKPLSFTFLHFPEPNVPDQASPLRDRSPWIPATHPDGALYFHDPKRRLFTDTDMHDPPSRERIEYFYSHLEEIERVEHLTIPSKNYDIVLDITLQKDNKMQWSYYYACHDTRCLFWLHEYDPAYITSELDGVESPAHFRHRLESLYWNHWSLFPVVFEGRSLPLGVYDELMGILAHGCIDVMTSSSSTLPYDDDQMQKMIGLVQKAKEARRDLGSMSGASIASGVSGISSVSGSSGADGIEHYTAATTRLLSFFAHWRFLYFHGQRHARLVCDQSAYDTKSRKRSALVSFLSPLLFFAPEVHLMEMDKLWTDEVIIERVWKSFMTKLLSEWNDLILWSTVMLAVDVSFLATPGVVPYSLQGTISPKTGIIVSLSETTTVISLGASVGSTIISLLLMRHNRTKQEVSPAEAWNYLSQTSRMYFGLELMAIVFSLPWALLMWSMLMFSMALFLYCWSISTHGSHIVILSVSGVLFVVLWACVWTIWESSDKWEVWRDGLRVRSRISRALQALHLSRLRDAVVLFRKRFRPYSTNDVGSSHELAGRRDGIVGGGV